MERVPVIGCGGSGKTTLSCRLGEILGLPVVHIDAQYWREVDGRRIESTPEQWAQHHSELVSRDRWIIDGMKLGVLPTRLAAADTVIYLDLPTRVCLMGILRRRIRFHGQLHPELGVYDRISWEFLRWISSFRRRQRPRILELLDAFEGDVAVLRRRRDVRRLLVALNTSNRSEHPIGNRGTPRVSSLALLPDRDDNLRVRSEDRKTLALTFGSQRAAVIRLRGWERYACVSCCLMGVAVGALALASQVGASISGEIVHIAQGVAGALAVAFIIAVFLAMRRYDGETRQLPPSLASRLAARVARR